MKKTYDNEIAKNYAKRKEELAISRELYKILSTSNNLQSDIIAFEHKHGKAKTKKAIKQLKEAFPNRF